MCSVWNTKLWTAWTRRFCRVWATSRRESVSRLWWTMWTPRFCWLLGLSRQKICVQTVDNVDAARLLGLSATQAQRVAIFKAPLGASGVLEIHFRWLTMMLLGHPGRFHFGGDTVSILNLPMTRARSLRSQFGQDAYFVSGPEGRRRGQLWRKFAGELSPVGGDKVGASRIVIVQEWMYTATPENAS